jgi:hypothetical protein
MKKPFVIITVFSIVTLGLTAESFAKKGDMRLQESGGAKKEFTVSRG